MFSARMIVSLPHSHLSSNRVAWACFHDKDCSKKGNGSRLGPWRPRFRASTLMFAHILLNNTSQKVNPDSTNEETDVTS